MRTGGILAVHGKCLWVERDGKSWLVVVRVGSEPELTEPTIMIWADRDAAGADGDMERFNDHVWLWRPLTLDGFAHGSNHGQVIQEAAFGRVFFEVVVQNEILGRPRYQYEVVVLDVIELVYGEVQKVDQLGEDLVCPFGIGGVV